jgi:D-3-phosphoglycerate dehydrogenase / 2-oxoglutarate reductase
MTQALLACTILVTPRSFGVGDPDLRRELAAAVREVRYNDRGRPLRAAELRAALEDVDGLLAGLDEIDASVIATAPRLRVIARYGVGISNVDLQAAARAGVVVTNTPGANAEAVAELTIGFLFALARSIPRADRAGRAGHWHALPGSELLGKTVGILGLGKIGQAVARRAAGLGCSVLAYDPILDPTFNARHQVRTASPEEVVRQAHFLTLHLPLLPETRDLVDRGLLARMREGSFLINTARGELVVEEDLLWALETGRLQGAALDTLRAEPPPADHPLLTREDVILTPHIGANTAEARTAMGRLALHDLLAVLAGRPPRFPVTLPSGGHS